MKVATRVSLSPSPGNRLMNGISKVAFSVRAAHKNEISLSDIIIICLCNPNREQHLTGEGSRSGENPGSEPQVTPPPWTVGPLRRRSIAHRSFFRFFSSSGLGRFARVSECGISHERVRGDWAPLNMV